MDSDDPVKIIIYKRLESIFLLFFDFIQIFKDCRFLGHLFIFQLPRWKIAKKNPVESFPYFTGDELSNQHR